MEVIEILSEEKELLLKMLDTLKAEKDALVNDDIDKLKAAVKRKQELKYGIDGIETARIEKCGDKTLKELILLFEGREKDEMKLLGKEITDAVREIQEINDMNRRLVKQSLNYIRAVRNMISPPKVNVYNSTGIIDNNSPASRLLDKKL